MSEIEDAFEQQEQDLLGKQVLFLEKVDGVLGLLNATAVLKNG